MSGNDDRSCQGPACQDDERFEVELPALYPCDAAIPLAIMACFIVPPFTGSTRLWTTIRHRIPPFQIHFSLGLRNYPGGERVQQVDTVTLLLPFRESRVPPIMWYWAGPGLR